MIKEKFFIAGMTYKPITLPKAKNSFGGVAGAGKQYHAAPAEGDGLQQSAAQGGGFPLRPPCSS